MRAASWCVLWLAVASCWVALPVAKAEPGSLPERDLLELGGRLFADPAASASGHTACIDCHDPGASFSDPRALSADDASVTPRRSQSLVDIDEGAGLHWDGSIDRVETLVSERVVTGASSGPVRTRTARPRGAAYYGPARLRGMPSGVDERMLAHERFPQVVARLGTGFQPTVLPHETGSSGARLLASARYEEVLTLAGASTPAAVESLAVRAMSAYVRSLTSGRGRVDRALTGEPLVLPAGAERGLALFRGRAGCDQCHSLKPGADGRVLLRDGSFHNTGVSFLSQGRVVAQQRARLVAAERAGARSSSSLSPLRRMVEGAERALATGRVAGDGVGDIGRARRDFKTPSLRGVAQRAPYMHDGSLATLADVVRHYAAGCGTDPERAKSLKGFAASEQDVGDIVAFLETLSDEMPVGVGEQPWRDRAASTRVQVLDALGQPLAHAEIVLVPAGLKAWRAAPEEAPRVARTDAQGWFEFTVGSNTHVRVVLEGAGRPACGDMIPDTCHETCLRFPVEGRMELEVRHERGQHAVPTLSVWLLAEGSDAEVAKSWAAGAPSNGQRREDPATVDPEPWSLRRVAVEEVMPVGAPPGEPAARLVRFAGYRPHGRRLAFVALPLEPRPRLVELAPKVALH